MDLPVSGVVLATNDELLPPYTWSLTLPNSPGDRAGTVAAGAVVVVSVLVVPVDDEDDDAVGVVKGLIPAGSAPPLAEAATGRPDEAVELGGSSAGVDDEDIGTASESTPTGLSLADELDFP